MNVHKLKYFIYLIEKQRTGAPSEVAKKLGVSERTIYSYVNTLKYAHIDRLCAREYIFSFKIESINFLYLNNYPKKIAS